MKKSLLSLFFFTILGLAFTHSAYAIYNPNSVANNEVGIHILFPSELSDAAKLVNSSGGDWGYVTIPIQETDMDLVKWQNFMDDCSKYHIIPIIRLATADDYFNKGDWEAPTDYNIIDFANFLNSLNWPTKNRYVIVYNEPNRGDEWGGSPDPAGYAQILDYAVKVFKERSSDFFIISAGLDNAASNVDGQSINEYTFMREMNYADPGVFGKIDGIASHSYPNPGFSQPPLPYMYEGVSSFKYEDSLAEFLGEKNLPVFITETGWSNNKVPESVQSSYYADSFGNIWDDKNVVAVTPFLLDAGAGPFAQFSFMSSNSQETDIYKTIQDMKKTKGQPELNNFPPKQDKTLIKAVLPVIAFDNKGRTDYTARVSRAAIVFFKWLLNF